MRPEHDVSALKLSPLNLSGLIARERLQAKEAQEQKEVRHSERVVMYRCLDCDELHAHELYAEECCSDRRKDEPTGNAAAHCPVCGQRAESWDAYGSVDCCLWKDISPLDRQRIARLVDGGAGWREAIASVTDGAHA